MVDLDFDRSLEQVQSPTGETLTSLSNANPLLVVFVRHLGCTFCRQAMADLARDRDAIEAEGVRIAIVHMDEPARASSFFAEYGLADVPQFSDPDRVLYRAFGLERGSLRQIMGLSVITRGFRSAILERHWFGAPKGDVHQLPGVFLLNKGKIVNEFRHKTSADRPDYCRLAGNEGCAT